MPKKKTLWKRDYPCLVCETPMINYQFMTKSQTIVYDEWMVAHTSSIGEYEEYPESLKTSVCPGCLTASNEYNYGVDSLKTFTRNPRKNNQIKEFYENCIEDRFKLLSAEFYRFEKESAVLDKNNKRPPNTRSKATFEKIWSQREQYGVPFFTFMLQEPRDLVTTMVCFALDRYCQMVRICYNYDVDPDNWEYNTIADALEQRFIDDPLSMKAPEPRFYYIGINYLQAIEFLNELNQTLYGDDAEKHADTLKEYWKDAYRFMKLSFDNDDLSAIPLEMKDAGLNLLMARMHLKFNAGEEALKCLKFAKNYADNRMKSISSTNQQTFVNDVDAMAAEYLKKPEVDEEEGEDGDGAAE